ncbi:transcription termination/antitermination protein NusA [Clostridia bacterium]|nr:transcription termination/antitermination protein NusA [Clostridia bacterium]
MKKKSTISSEIRIDEQQFFDALLMLAEENAHAANLEELTERIEDAIKKAIKKSYPNCEKVFVKIDADTKKITANVMKLIVDDDELDDGEINIDKAKLIDKNAIEGEMLAVPVNIAEFGRVAAIAAKQSVKEDVKKIHRESILKKFDDKEFKCLAVKVTRIEPGSRNVTVDYEGSELYLFPNEQLPNEIIREGQFLKVYVTSISNRTKRPIIKISRAHKDLLKALFELNIPEVSDGTVEIKSIARDPGYRSKVAVTSNDVNVNAVSSCIGKKNIRIKPIVDELNGEKIDVIEYSEKPEVYIASALAPAEITEVIITDEFEHTCTVTVASNQLSLAIGNRGQNAKLAAKLTGYKIDIKSDDELEEIGRANRLAEENRVKYAERLKALEDDSFETIDDSVETDILVDTNIDLADADVDLVDTESSTINITVSEGTVEISTEEVSLD